MIYFKPRRTTIETCKVDFKEKPAEFKIQQHRFQEHQKGYLEKLSNSLDQTEKCPLSAYASFYKTHAIL